MNKYDFCGKHLLCEVYEVEFSKLNSISQIKDMIYKCIEVSKATLLDEVSFKFSPHGVTVMALLAESHISVHTYPEDNAMFFDMFTCGFTCKPENCISVIKSMLDTNNIKKELIVRGKNEN